MSTPLEKLNVLEAKVFTASAAQTLSINWEEIHNRLKRRGHSSTKFEAQETLARCDRQLAIDQALARLRQAEKLKHVSVELECSPFQKTLSEKPLVPHDSCHP